MDTVKLLFEYQDIKYRDFEAKLCPTLDKEFFIGVRTPELKRLAKEILKSGGEEEFLKSLPHRYFEENQLHAFIISEMKDYGRALMEVKKFLPYINNWATCDQLIPKSFKKNSEYLLSEIRVWIKSDGVYTVRFAIGCLMRYFLEEGFDPSYLSLVADVKSDEYYINMMSSWYFATALTKQYDSTISFFEQQKLPFWVHNKAISKAHDSYRITPSQKEYLKTLKIKKT